MDSQWLVHASGLYRSIQQSCDDSSMMELRREIPAFLKIFRTYIV